MKLYKEVDGSYKKKDSNTRVPGLQNDYKHFKETTPEIKNKKTIHNYLWNYS